MNNFVRIRNIILVLAGIVIVLGLLVWVGLKIKPKSFPTYPGETPLLKTIPLPTGLPAPVERFYTNVYGDEIPIIESVVIQGRGSMKPFMNIPVPTRFVFVHDAGKNYRHYFEATLFGIPIMKVNEGYINGVSFFEGPMGTYNNEANANQGANLALWAEAVWFPSLWLTDSRAHWEPVDNHSALLFIPYENTEDSFMVRFNPQTGLIDTMEAMRYRELGQGQPKILWITSTEEGQPIPGLNINSVGSAMWLDQGKPWAYFNLEKLFYNVDMDTYILQKGI